MLPSGEYEVHQNSIFDLIWLKGANNKVLTASGDMESTVFDLEHGQVSQKLSKMHEASIKALTQLESNENVVVTGGREGRIVVHDIRQKDAGSITLNKSTVISWRNASNQLVLTNRINSQSASITGLTSYGDQSSP